MKITLLGLNHDLQWKDPTGDLRRIVSELLSGSQIDLIAEEASGLPTTIAQRLACKLDKPWVEIDMSAADRKLARIYKRLTERPTSPIGVPSIGRREDYLPREDGIRETEWVTRILHQNVDAALCLCGLLHADPFKQKLENRGCSVEHINLTEEAWFKKLYGSYRIVARDCERWLEIRYTSRPT
jgi:hypothetical protein